MNSGLIDQTARGATYKYLCGSWWSACQTDEYGLHELLSVSEGHVLRKQIIDYISTLTI